MGSNLPSQHTEDKSRIHSRQSETKGKQVQHSSDPHESSTPPPNSGDPTRSPSQPTRRTLRARCLPERPLLDLIERQELSGRLMAILDELWSRRGSCGTSNEGAPIDG